MSKSFMGGTKLQGSEKLMMGVPKFNQNRSGICTMKELKKKCSGCIYYENNSCQLPQCSFMIERIKLGIASYDYMIKDSFKPKRGRRIGDRLLTLIKVFDGKMFLNEEHKARFLNKYKLLFSRNSNQGNEYMAALYLLTADEELCKRMKQEDHLYDINFKKICLKGIGTDGYALYHGAKTIYTGSVTIEQSEMADSTLIKDHVFKAIIHGGLIQKYSKNILELKFKK